MPLHIQQLRGAASHDLVRTALRAARVLGSRGDLLQFTTPRRTGTQRAAVAEAFDALARGLAALTVHLWKLLASVAPANNFASDEDFGRRYAEQLCATALTVATRYHHSYRADAADLLAKWPDVQRTGRGRIAR